MFVAPPATGLYEVPHEIDALLKGEGWEVAIRTTEMVYYSPSNLSTIQRGLYTWEQALMYHMYKRLSLA